MTSIIDNYIAQAKQTKEEVIVELSVIKAEAELTFPDQALNASLYKQ